MGIESYIGPCVFFIFYLPNYIGIAVWEYFYTKTTIEPEWSPSRSTNKSSDIRGEFAGILIFAIFAGFSNLVACIKFLLVPLCISYSDDKLPGARSPGRRSSFIFYLYLLVACLFTVFVSSVLFVAPFVTPAWSWRSAYKHSCDGMDLWVPLDLPDVRQTNEVTFENRVSGKTFSMAMSPDPVATGFNDSGIYNFNVISTSTNLGSPALERIEYNIPSSRYTIYTTNNVAISNGDFTTGKQFLLPVLNMKGNLELFESRCVFDPTAKIVDSRERGGEVLVKTTQFNICGPLVVCAKERVGVDVAVPVGLLMLGRAKRGGNCCKSKHRIPGVEGRDYL